MNLSQKCVLVTEGTTRSGRLICATLAKLGATVIIGASDTRGGNNLRDTIIAKHRNTNIHVRHIDLDNLRTLKRSATLIKSSFPHLNAIIHNTDQIHFRKKLTSNGFEASYGHNVLAPFCLTMSLIDVLAESARATIITLASDAFPQGIEPFNGTFSMKTGKRDVAEDGSARVYDPLIAYSEAKLAALVATRVLHNRLPNGTAALFALDAVHSCDQARSPQLWSTYLNSRFKAPSTVAAAIPQLLLANKKSPYSGCLIRDGKPSRKGGAFHRINEDALWEKILTDIQQGIGSEKEAPDNPGALAMIAQSPMDATHSNHDANNVHAGGAA